jgi:hypothetical protein
MICYDVLLHGYMYVVYRNRYVQDIQDFLTALEQAELKAKEWEWKWNCMAEQAEANFLKLEQAEARVKDLEIKVRAYEEENPNIAYDCGKRIKELEGKIKPLKNALRSCMNELLKDCVSPELQDYFDYVKDLKSRLAAAESLHDLYVSETAKQINDLKLYKEATQNKESERERQLAAAREGFMEILGAIDNHELHHDYQIATETIRCILQRTLAQIGGGDGRS